MMIGSASFSVDGKYRYLLERVWDRSKESVCFVMLNPSVAGAIDSDKTIDRCISYAKSWGFGGIEVVNLFAYVSTDPNELFIVDDPIGPENDYYIKKSIESNSYLILGWGNIGNHQKRAQDFLNTYSNEKFKCLKKNKDGSPGHPLYLSGDLNPIVY